jgi:hypothetical protein
MSWAGEGDGAVLRDGERGGEVQFCFDAPVVHRTRTRRGGAVHVGPGGGGRNRVRWFWSGGDGAQHRA